MDNFFNESVFQSERFLKFICVLQNMLKLFSSGKEYFENKLEVSQHAENRTMFSRITHSAIAQLFEFHCSYLRDKLL